MRHSNASILNSVEFFNVCNDEQLNLLAFASENLNFYSNQIMMEKGEMSEGAYIINHGVVSLGEKAENSIRISGPGLMIGELSLLVKRVHHDRVMAQGMVDCLFVPRSAFQKLIKQYPDLAPLFAKKIEASLDDYLQSISSFSK